MVPKLAHFNLTFACVISKLWKKNKWKAVMRTRKFAECDALENAFSRFKFLMHLRFLFMKFVALLEMCFVWRNIRELNDLKVAPPGKYFKRKVGVERSHVSRCVVDHFTKPFQFNFEFGNSFNYLIPLPKAANLRSFVVKISNVNRSNYNFNRAGEFAIHTRRRCECNECKYFGLIQLISMFVRWTGA